jgi:hypothetical protein
MSSINPGSGIGFAGMLTLIFIVLKLCKIVAWSWMWVLSPLWIGAIIGAICLGIFIFFGLK